MKIKTNVKLLVDTDILIDYLREHPHAVRLLESSNNPLIISCISVAELYAGARNDNEKTILSHFLELFEIAPLNHEIAELGGSYKKTFGKSHGIGLADALIAATAAVYEGQLITLNIRHYPMFKNLKSAYSKN